MRGDRGVFGIEIEVGGPEGSFRVIDRDPAPDELQLPDRRRLRLGRELGREGMHDFTETHVMAVPAEPAE